MRETIDAFFAWGYAFFALVETVVIFGVCVFSQGVCVFRIVGMRFWHLLKSEKIPLNMRFSHLPDAFLA